jgi:hypothetical protein
MKTPASRTGVFGEEVPDVGNGTVSLRFSATKITITIGVGDVIVVVEIPLVSRPSTTLLA